MRSRKAPSRLSKSMVWGVVVLLVSTVHKVRDDDDTLSAAVGNAIRIPIDVHMKLEEDIADFLGTEAAIVYAQGFSTISSVIPAFCKRGDIIVADRGVNFAIQKGLQMSRSTIRWYDHNDMKSLELVLETIEKERRKKKGPLTRRFIVTEGIFDHDGTMSDLPKLVCQRHMMKTRGPTNLSQVELKHKYKYRLILDESFSFGSVGRTGRGLTELYNVPVCSFTI